MSIQYSAFGHQNENENATVAMVMGTTKPGFTPGILRTTGCESRLPVYSSGNIVLISCCTITMATYYNDYYSTPEFTKCIDTLQ